MNPTCTAARPQDPHPTWPAGGGRARCAVWLSAITLTLACLAPSKAPAQARVDVTFVDAEHYRDAGDSDAERRQHLGELERQLQRLGAAVTAPGQRLRIEVMQVDLAGQPQPFVGGRVEPTRVLTGTADWPRIDLRWQLLRSDGATDRSGEASIDDKTYLQRPIPRNGMERLPYEQRMLAQWFKATFGPAK